MAKRRNLGTGTNRPRREIERQSSYTVTNAESGVITKVVFPNPMQVGANVGSYPSHINVFGHVTAHTGFTGSLTRLIDGSAYLKAGNNIVLATGSTGQITITSTGTSIGTLENALTTGDGLRGVLTSDGTTVDSTFDGSEAITVKVLAANSTLSVDSSGVKVLSVPNAVTSGDGISTLSYDGSSAASVAVDVVANGGLAVGASGVNISPSNSANVAAAVADTVLVGDATDSFNVKNATVQSIIDLADAGFSGTTTNPLTFSDGITVSAGSTFDGSAAITVSAKGDSATTSVAAGGISVLKVPNHLTGGPGFHNLSFDGSAQKVISIATSSLGGLSFESAKFLKVDIMNTVELGASPATNDSLLIYDVTSTIHKRVTVNELLSLVTSSNEPDADWNDHGSKLVTTSSVAAVGNLPPANTAESYGPYTYFFVSGSIGAGSLPSSGVATFGGDILSSGTFTAKTGLTGSLTKLPTGKSYLAAETGIIITTASDGQVSARIDNSIVATLTGSTFTGPVHFSGSVSDFTATGSVKFNAGLTGSLTKLVDGTSFIAPDRGILISTGANDQIQVGIDNSIVATLTGSTFTGPVHFSGSVSDFTATGSVTFNAGLTGSLTKLINGTSFIVGGGGCVVTTSSNGQVHIFAGHGGDDSGADPYASFVLMSATASLPNERVLSVSTGLRSIDGGAGSSVTLSVKDSVVAMLTGSTFTGPVHFSGSVSDFTATGSVKFNSGLSGSLQMLTDGSTPYIIGTGSISITTSSSGQLVVSGAASSGAGNVSVGQTGGSTVSNVTTLVFTGSTVADDGGGSVTVTPVIGASEDGSYDDGLFTDFTYTTNIGTAIDRFNEVLKGLAPSAAPSLDDVNCSDSGTSANLSFGSSQSIGGYTNTQPSTLTPTDNLSDVDINGEFSSATVSNDVRVACFDGSTVINGDLNADVSSDSPNYDADSFGDADQGTLKLFVNDNSTAVHSVDLSSFGSGNSLNGNGSGFNLSAVTSGHFSDGTSFDTFKHRQGTYIIVAAEQREGWNYARVVHTIGSTDTTTNYVGWVNDSDSNALSSDNSAMDSLSMSGENTLSGVKYFTAGTANYRIRVLNAYRNIYSTSTITFNGSNCSVSSQAFPSIDYAGGETEARMLHLTGSATITGDPILNSSITVSTNVPHPLKSNLSSAGSQSISGILLYDLSNTSTSTSETFRAENYRILSGSYDAQADVTDAGNTWSSAIHMSGSNTGYTDGLLYYNQRLYAPVQGGSSGDFRNTSDGGSIANGPDDNVNYSGITSGTRTFYRYFTNTSGGSQTDFSLTINGSGTIANQGTALTTSNLHVLIKLPTTSDPFSTGWMDLAVAFSTGQISDGDGCLVGSLDSSLSATNSATFGTQSVGNGQYIVIKIEADADLTGYISSMSISWG